MVLIILAASIHGKLEWSLCGTVANCNATQAHGTSLIAQNHIFQLNDRCAGRGFQGVLLPNKDSSGNLLDPQYRCFHS